MADYLNYSLEQLKGCKNDHEAWYWLGMAYLEQGYVENAVEWLGKAVNDDANDWQEKATQELGVVYMTDGHPFTDRDKAMDLFEKVSNYGFPKIYMGILYYRGTRTRHDLKKGIELIDKGIAQIKEKLESDEKINAQDCYQIATIYHLNEDKEKAREYFQKTIDRADSSFEAEIIDGAKGALLVLK